MDKYAIILENVSLKEYSTIGIGGRCKYLAKPYTAEDTALLIKYLKENNIKYYVLGNMSNVIIDDKDFDGVIIKLDNLDKIEIEGNIITAGAGVMMPKLVNIALQKGLTSLAFASMIPGTVGGCVCGNAGSYDHEVLEFVTKVTVLDKEGNLKVLDKDDITYGYRHTSLVGNYIILSVSFISSEGDAIKELTEIQTRNEKRRDSQPLDKPSVGSIFRNPEGGYAGKIIEELGFKGKSIGGAKVSEKHANFIINEGSATFDDVINLIDLIKKEVKEKKDIDLVLEPKIIKWDEVWVRKSTKKEENLE